MGRIDMLSMCCMCTCFHVCMCLECAVLCSLKSMVMGYYEVETMADLIFSKQIVTHCTEGCLKALVSSRE